MIDLETIKAICKQSDMWELDNPRVVGMINNIINCIEQEEDLNDEAKITATNIVLSNLIIFGKYNIENKI